MRVGDLIRVALPGGRAGGAQVIAATERAVGLRLGAVIWGCSPGADELAEGPWVVEVAVPRARLAGVAEVVGHAEAPPAAMGAVMDAPLPVLFEAMVGLAG